MDEEEKRTDIIKLNPKMSKLAMTLFKYTMRAITDKFIAAEQKHGWTDDWFDSTPESLEDDFWIHVNKGDPKDIAIYCIFFIYKGYRLKNRTVLIQDKAKSTLELVD